MYCLCDAFAVQRSPALPGAKSEFGTNLEMRDGGAARCFNGPLCPSRGSQDAGVRTQVVGRIKRVHPSWRADHAAPWRRSSSAVPRGCRRSSWGERGRVCVDLSNTRRCSSIVPGCPWLRPDWAVQLGRGKVPRSSGHFLMTKPDRSSSETFCMSLLVRGRKKQDIESGGCGNLGSRIEPVRLVTMKNSRVQRLFS